MQKIRSTNGYAGTHRSGQYTLCRGRYLPVDDHQRAAHQECYPVGDHRLMGDIQYRLNMEIEQEAFATK